MEGAKDLFEGGGAFAEGLKGFVVEGVFFFGDEEVELGLKAALDLEDLHLIFCFEDIVVLTFEQGAKRAAFAGWERGEVKHKILRAALGTRAWRVGSRGRVTQQGEREPHGRPFLFLGFDVQPTAALAKIPVDERKTHTAMKIAGVVCGHGFERKGGEVRSDAVALIADHNTDKSPALDARPAFVWSDLDVFGVNAQGAALWHGLFGIVEEGIHDLRKPCEREMNEKVFCAALKRQLDLGFLFIV